MKPVLHRALGEFTPTQGKALARRVPVAVCSEKRAPVTQDTLKFSGQNTTPLIQKYGLSAQEIPVRAPAGFQVTNKAQLIEQALTAMETAKKWHCVGNESKRYLGTRINLSNGIWATGVNVELFRDCTLCAERSALTTAQCKALDETPLDVMEANAPGDNNKTFVESWTEGLKVKTLVLASETLGRVPAICSDCESWMTSTRYFTPETQLVWLEKDKPTDILSLRVQPLKERLPFWGKNQPSVSEKPLESLPVQISDSAREAMKQRGFDEAALRGLLVKAKAQFSQDAHAIYTGKNMASAMLFSSGLTESASRVDITKRWSVPGDLTAFSLGIQPKPQAVSQKSWFTLAQECWKNPWGKLQECLQSLWSKVTQWFKTGRFESPPPPVNHIQAIAYYGNDNDVPPMVTTGYFAQPTRGGLDTLLALVERDTIQIRTIRDYRPLTYISDFQQPAGK